MDTRANPRAELLYRRVLDAAESERLLSFAAGPVAAYSDACVHELFERQVARTPDAVALRCADGEMVTYADLNARANQLARHLPG